MRRSELRKRSARLGIVTRRTIQEAEHGRNEEVMYLLQTEVVPRLSSLYVEMKSYIEALQSIDTAIVDGSVIRDALLLPAWDR